MLRINNDKAILIAQEQIRTWRDAAFAENDVRIQNALADGNEDARLRAVLYREYLRNLPQQCEGKNITKLTEMINTPKNYVELIKEIVSDED